MPKPKSYPRPKNLKHLAFTRHAGRRRVIYCHAPGARYAINHSQSGRRK